MLAENWSQEPEACFEPWQSDMGRGILTSVLTTRPNISMKFLKFFIYAWTTLFSELCRIIAEGGHLIPCAFGEVTPATKEHIEAAGGYSAVSINEEFPLGSPPTFNSVASCQCPLLGTSLLPSWCLASFLRHHNWCQHTLIFIIWSSPKPSSLGSGLHLGKMRWLQKQLPDA